MSEIHIPQKVVKLIKPKLVKALDEVYSTENDVYTSSLKRIKLLNTLIQNAYEEKLLGKSPLKETEYNKSMSMWQEEKELLSEKIKSATKVNKSLYSNIDTLMKFLQNVDNTYKNANIENKQKLLHLICDKVTYDTETGKLTVKLKPIFQALRIVKDNSKYCSEKVTTLPKVSGKTVLEYLTQNIEFSLKNKVTTLKTLIIPNEKAPEGANPINGASDGTRHEPNYTELAQMCLHETEVMSEIEKWRA